MPLPATDYEFLRYKSSTPSGSETPITLRTNSTWTHVGLPLNPSSLPASYQTWSTGTLKSGDLLPLLADFITFLNAYLANTHMTHYCLSIRAQLPTTDYDAPRWHVDRRFFDPPKPEGTEATPCIAYMDEDLLPRSDWKLATALIGPGTLFLSDGVRARRLQKQVNKRLRVKERKKGHFAVDDEHVCSTLQCLGCADMAENVRVAMAGEVKKNKMKVEQLSTGECSIFRVEGVEEGKSVGAVHSEPVMSVGDRLFVHVVPGREEELRRLMKGWGMDFPRDWSVGVLENWKG